MLRVGRARPTPLHSPTDSQQLVERDRQIANALAGRVEDGVGDRRRYAHDADFAQSLGAERVDDRIVLFDEDHINLIYVGVHGDVILRQIVVYETSEVLVHHALFFQRHADAPDNAAHNLTPGRLGIQDTPAGDGADDARDADYAQVLIDFHLREDCRMRIPGVLRSHLFVRASDNLFFDTADSRMAHGVLD